MSEGCVFCGIVSGDIPSNTVYEDEDVQAFLDVNPLTLGHTLVIPKEHCSQVADLSEGTGRAVFDTLRRLTPVVQRAVNADGTTIGINDGEAAGQEIPHVHGHIVPRESGDGAGTIQSLRWPRPDLDDATFAEIAESIRSEQG